MAGRVRLTRRGKMVVFAVGAMVSGALAYGALGTADASLAVNEVSTIPTSGPSAGTFTILGRGYGHGHGLSQYGAKGAAERGLLGAQILAFYYPGTAQAHAGGTIRVLLSGLSDPLEVTPTTTLTAVDTGNGSSTPLPTYISGQPVTRWALGTNAGGGTVLFYFQGGWVPYKSFAGDGEFIDPQLGYVTIASPSVKQYSGALLAASPVRGARQRAVVNIVSLEDYVASVTPSEMPSAWPTQALAAQASAARTYAVFERAAHSGNYYDICDSTMCQVYNGRGAQTAATNQVTADTAGVYLTYQGQPAFTQFSSSNAGWESAGGKAYLPSQADPYTPTPEQMYGRDYSWSQTASTAALQNAYPSIGSLRSITITSREGGTGATWGGRVVAMTLTGSAGSVSISGDRFAAIYGLGSSWFRLQVPQQTYAVGSHVASGAAGLGQPTGPEVEMSVFGVTGYYQNFPGGYGVINSPFGTFVSNGAIYATWNPANSGWPTGAMYGVTAGGISGYQQNFSQGNAPQARAFWSPQYPLTRWVNGSILTKYDELGGTGALGWPTAAMTSQTAFNMQGWTQSLQGGYALIASQDGVFLSNGSILATWSPALYGWPSAAMVSRVYRGEQGWIQLFDKGTSGPDFAFADAVTRVPTWSNGTP